MNRRVSAEKPSARHTHTHAYTYAVQMILIAARRVQVYRWIMLTIDHRCDADDTADAKLFMDMDMAIIGQQRERYDEYAQQESTDERLLGLELRLGRRLGRGRGFRHIPPSSVERLLGVESRLARGRGQGLGFRHLPPLAGRALRG